MDDSPESTHQAMPDEYTTSSEGSTNPHSQRNQLENEDHLSGITDSDHHVDHDSPPRDPEDPAFQEAISYLQNVKAKIDREIYKDFLQALTDYEAEDLDERGVFDRVSDLFHEYPDLVGGFRRFLPFAFDDSNSMGRWVEVKGTSEGLDDPGTSGCHLAVGGSEPETLDTVQPACSPTITSTVVQQLPGSEMPSSDSRWEESQNAGSLSYLMSVVQLHEVGGTVRDNLVGSSISWH